MMKRSSLITVLVIIVWFALATVAVFWVSLTSKADFDPNLSLSQEIMSLEFEAKLLSALPLTTLVSAPKSHLAANYNIALPLNESAQQTTLYHFTQGECYCELLAKNHQSTLQSWSADVGVKNIFIDLKAYPHLTRFIPSTPSVLAVSNKNELIYLGPYSRGSGCFTNSGMVDAYLVDWLSKDQAENKTPRAIIDTESKGCYCATSKPLYIKNSSHI